MHTDQASLKALKLAGYTSFLTIAISTTATAQPVGKYAGSSANWRPDYAGTIRMVQTDGKRQVYSAIADVELKAKPSDIPSDDSDGKVVQYEMRGMITLTSPVVKGTYLCTADAPASVSIADSGMNLYQGGEFGKGTAYEIRINRFIRIPNCTSPTLGKLRSDAQTMQINFDSSYQSAAQAEAELNALPKPTEADITAMEEQKRAVDAMMEDSEVKQALERLQQSGNPPSEAEMIALAERLQQNSRVVQGVKRPKLSPTLQAAGDRKTDYSHLKRTNNPDHLKDQMTLDFGAGRGSQTFSWDLRRVR
ncbi:hypothetical protein Q2T42_23440 [Leptolyngbya boryana CZ1]|uniref:Uncharacterized protein n=1 Tax=Leptolyngbya boryana CZ1 TaxID=3060204 RepID=A0AA96WS39_LEPBY|nr:hypothetical protein [Leptolyngbya boryana]WNZ44751.1 hypothetical protein Q2T42_23440 [Leptolyngbya boryana CZ1]